MTTTGRMKMRRIWAVAVNTIKQAVRLKVAIIFIIILAVVIPVMGFTTTGDGTLKGRLQTFVSYNLSLTSLMLSILTVVTAIYTLTSDIKQKQIFTVVTKPVRRFQLICGKLLGVIIVNAVLLFLFTGLIYAFAVMTLRYVKSPPDELTTAKDEFFTARAGMEPPVANVSDEVEKSYERLEKSGQLERLFEDLTKEKILERLTRRKQLEKRAATVGQKLVWEFHNIKPLEHNQSIFIRYKYDVSVNPPDLQVGGKWIVGDLRQLEYGTRIETPIREFDRKEDIRTFHEIKVPADVIADDGYLGVAFVNVPLNNTVIIFPLNEGIEVLYKADSFTANYVKNVLLLLLRIVFLAVLGLFTATFLSFPVAILVCFVVFFTAYFSSFVLDSFDYLSGNISLFYIYFFKPILRFLPQFDKANPTDYIVPARLLCWEKVAKTAGVMICIKAVVAFLMGLIIFRYKELAKVTV